MGKMLSFLLFWMVIMLVEKLIEKIEADDAAGIKALFKNSQNKMAIDKVLSGALENYGFYTPLTLAARLGKKAALKELLDQGANPDIQNLLGQNALVEVLTFEEDLAIKPQLVADVFRILLKKGAKTDYLTIDGATLLVLLAQDGYVEAAKILLQNAPQLLNTRRADGCAPLDFAVRYGHLAMVKLLCKKNVDIGIQKWTGSSLWHEFSECNKDTKEIGQELLAWPNIPNVNQQDDEGLTPLMQACVDSNMEAVKFLLESGADTTLVTHDESSAAITCAIQSSNFALLKLFRGHPVAYTLMPHPANNLIYLNLDPRIFNLFLDELILQGYGFGKEIIFAAIPLVLSKEQQWKVEALIAKGANVSQIQYDETHVQITIRPALLANLPQEELKVIPEATQSINKIQMFLVERPQLMQNETSMKTHDDLLDLLKLVDERYLEELSCLDIFYKILRLITDTSNNSNLLPLDFLKAGLKFFKSMLRMPDMKEDALFVTSYQNFYKALTNMSEFSISNDDLISIYASLLDCITLNEEGRTFYKYTSLRLREKLDDLNSFNRFSNISTNFLERVLELSSENVLNNKRKLDFILVHLQTLHRLHKAYDQKKTSVPAVFIEEFAFYNVQAKKELSFLGENYVLDQDDLGAWEAAERQFGIAMPSVEKKGPAETEENGKNNQPPKNRSRKKTQNETREASSQKTVGKEDKAADAAEELQIKIKKLQENERLKQILEKKDQAYYLNLRKQAKQERQQKNNAPIPSPVAERSTPAFKWTENQVRAMYSECLQPHETIRPLYHPNGSALGTFWGCFLITQEQFEDPDEHPLYLQKFTEGKITFDIKASGIVFANNTYYLRIHEHLPRIHAHKYEREGDAPVLLKFDDYLSHPKHLSVMRATNPGERYNISPQPKGRSSSSAITF